MWNIDPKGEKLAGRAQAYAELRSRAIRAIACGDASGTDVRHLMIRLRDGAGSIFFEGSMQDAAQLRLDAQGLPTTASNRV